MHYENFQETEFDTGGRRSDFLRAGGPAAALGAASASITARHVGKRRELHVKCEIARWT